MLTFVFRALGRARGGLDDVVYVILPDVYVTRCYFAYGLALGVLVGCFPRNVVFGLYLVGLSAEHRVWHLRGAAAPEPPLERNRGPWSP